MVSLRNIKKTFLSGSSHSDVVLKGVRYLSARIGQMQIFYFENAAPSDTIIYAVCRVRVTIDIIGYVFVETIATLRCLTGKTHINRR